MKSYIGTKIIRAEPMDEHTFYREYKRPYDPTEESRVGYMVQYPDGYISWSPTEVFEAAYREISPNEAALMADQPAPPEEGVKDPDPTEEQPEPTEPAPVEEGVTPEPPKGEPVGA